jgi:hypothetical protein
LAVPGKKFIAYQTGKVAPWWFKRRILWQRDTKLEPLYVSHDLAFSFDAFTDPTASGLEYGPHS